MEQGFEFALGWYSAKMLIGAILGGIFIILLVIGLIVHYFIDKRHERKFNEKLARINKICIGANKDGAK